MEQTSCKPKSITVEGRKWFDAQHGNTYHSAKVYADGIEVASVPFTYGYDNQWEHNAAEAMEEARMMPGREHYKNGGKEAPWRYFERIGITYAASAIDVSKRKDL